MLNNNLIFDDEKANAIISDQTTHHNSRTFVSQSKVWNSCRRTRRKKLMMSKIKIVVIVAKYFRRMDKVHSRKLLKHNQNNTLPRSQRTPTTEMVIFVQTNKNRGVWLLTMAPVLDHYVNTRSVRMMTHHDCDRLRYSSFP